jgi:glutaminyl-peptide cyclotransferase
LKNKIIFFLIVAGISCKNNSSEESTIEIRSIPILPYQIIGSFSHDEALFTEGLFVDNGLLYESTGSPANLPFTESLIGVLDTTLGKMDIKVRLDKSKYFGEGSTILNGKLYKLTYTSQTCFVYDAKTFKLINTFKYANKEGWGLTSDGSNLIMSDGTYKITVVNPSDFSKVREINVSENGYGIENIWFSPLIGKHFPKVV